MQQRMEKGFGPTYEVDTVLTDGSTLTSTHKVAAVGSLGTASGRKAFMELPAKMPNLRFVGVGVTEAGVAHNEPTMVALAEFLHGCFIARQATSAVASRGARIAPPISILNTDNVPFNGDAVKSHVLACDYMQGLDVEDANALERWLRSSVVFHNAMVDRITSMREGDTNVPRAEPSPAKALVIEDVSHVLPATLAAVPGVILRTESGELPLDIQLKLRVANGLHTAMAYTMALAREFTTDACADASSPILPYLEQLFERDVVHMASELGCGREAVTPVYVEWLARLQHRHFGISTFFVAQNATQKLSLRLVPSIRAVGAAGEAPSDFMAFALAAMLRYLTPIGEQPRIDEQPRPVFVGRLDAPGDGGGSLTQAPHPEALVYAAGLKVDGRAGTYEFADGNGLVPLLLRPLGRPRGASAVAVRSLTAQVLSTVDAAFSGAALAPLVCRVSELLTRMLGGGETCLGVLRSLDPSQPLFIPACKLREAVGQEVDAAEACDVHAHCFGPEYGERLMAFGIDKLLTAGYGNSDLACSPDLVAQYLAVADEPPEVFARLAMTEQADRIWEALFVRRSPLSEACLGVVTALQALGLHEALERRDLPAIRAWYATQDGARFNEKVLRLAKLRYVISSHSPFFSACQLDACLHPPPATPRYKAALEVDSLLEGDWRRVTATLDTAGEPRTLRGVANLLERCVGTCRPVYVSSSTPHTFTYQCDTTPTSPMEVPRREAWPVDPASSVSPGNGGGGVGGGVGVGGGDGGGGGGGGGKRRAVLASPPKSPGGARTSFAEAEDGFEQDTAAPAGVARSGGAGRPAGGFDAAPPASRAALRSAAMHGTPTLDATLDMPLAPWPPSSSTVLDAVLLPLCARHGLPLLLRMGTCRGINETQGLAGDGVGSARLDALTNLCASHPRHKFVVAVLDAAQQHAAAVIASRFRNVHIWGSWWFSALPSVAAEGTAMRMEMLGVEFTFCASSAKLHDQLIYKWKNSRALLTATLTSKYSDVAERGWRVSRGDIRRDVQRLLGGAFEDFLAKRL